MYIMIDYISEGTGTSIFTKNVIFSYTSTKGFNMNTACAVRSQTQTNLPPSVLTIQTTHKLNTIGFVLSFGWS